MICDTTTAAPPPAVGDQLATDGLAAVLAGRSGPAGNDRHEVLALDPETGHRGARSVEHVFVHDDILVDLSIGGDVVTTTEDHPFWNYTDQAFQRADELDAGDLVLTATRSLLAVDGIMSA